MYNDNAVMRFMDLFDGFKEGHGVTRIVGHRNSDGKLEGNSEWESGPITFKEVAGHLEGEFGIGVCPLRGDSTVRFGVLDIDEYSGLDPAKIAGQLAAVSLPLIPCLSKSGGVHVYLFTSEAVPASEMVKALRSIATLLGYAGSEIFPKSCERAPNSKSAGGWVNLPYYQGDTGTRYAVLPNGEKLSLTQFLDLAETSRVPAAWFDDPLPGIGAPEPVPRKKAFKLPDAIADGARNRTLTSLAGAMRSKGMSQAGILAGLRATNAEKCNPPLSDSDVERIAKSISRYQPNDGPEEGLTQDLAKAIKMDSFFARDAGGRLYAFEGGVYRPTGERVIQRRVKELCQVWGKTKAWSPELPGRVCEWIAVDSPDLWERPPLDFLNCRNGLLEVGTRTLYPHSPDHLSPVQIAVDYDRAAKCPHIEKFIRDVFPSDTQHLPWEIAGWLMLPDTSIQKAVLLLGEGANGKSVWLSLLERFLGWENVSSLSLHRIEADKFSAARLVGKLCNVGADLPTAALTGTSMFKALTGCDSITAERKFESSFEFRPFVRLLFSANSAPRSDDSTHGFFRRWLCVPFNRTFDESDPDHVPRAVLDARLSDPGELSGMLNRALDALPVIQQGRFTESASTRAALDEFRQTTDPLGVFLDQNTVELADASVPKEQLRRAYEQVCQDEGRPVLNDSRFTAALKRLRPKVEAKRRQFAGVQVQVFVGLGLRSQELPPDGLNF